MRTVYKHFTYQCSQKDCYNEVKKMFDVTDEAGIRGHVKCEKCGNDTLVLIERNSQSSSSSAAIIGEGDRWTKKLDPDLKYIMKNMKKRHPNSNIPDY